VYGAEFVRIPGRVAPEFWRIPLRKLEGRSWKPKEKGVGFPRSLIHSAHRISRHFHCHRAGACLNSGYLDRWKPGSLIIFDFGVRGFEMGGSPVRVISAIASGIICFGLGVAGTYYGSKHLGYYDPPPVGGEPEEWAAKKGPPGGKGGGKGGKGGKTSSGADKGDKGDADKNGKDDKPKGDAPADGGKGS
jgi:hypothetical protein